MTEHDPHRLDLPDEYHEKWHAFIEDFSALLAVHFTEEDDPAIVMGAQWGDMGSEEWEHVDCALTSNLPICGVPFALEEMREEAERFHREHHARTLTEPVSPDSVPEEVRAIAMQIAEQLGIDASDMQFVTTADISDLDSVEAEFGSDS